MKKKVMVGISTAALICSMGIMQAFAAGDTALAADAASPAALQAAEKGASVWMRSDGKELTEEEKAAMEEARAQREEKQNAFVNSLSSEQKALYDAMMPEKPADGEAAQPGEGQPFAKGMPAQLTDEEKAAMEKEMAAMKEKRDAFIASLTDEQKTTFEALFRGHGGGFHKELTEEEKAAMEEARAQREEKQNAFVDTLSSEQKALYDAMMPEKPADGEAVQPGEGQPFAKGMPAQLTDEEKAAMEKEMAAMKEKRDTFIASLTDEQKTSFEALFKGHGGGFHKQAEQDASAADAA